MAVSVGKRVSVLAGVVLAGIALVLPSTPALAQPFPAPTQATLMVGGEPLVNVNCPTPLPGQNTGGASSNPTATASGQVSCGNAPAANTQGNYTVGGAAGNFSAGCQSSNGDNGGFVTVPAGTSINGGPPVAAPTVVGPGPASVVFPNGTTAQLNVVQTTPTSVTRSAIVFANGTVIGRVICGLSGVYPLGVDVADAGEAAAPLPLTSSGDDGGLSIGTVVAAVVALALAAQLAVGARMRRRKGDATA
jgi:hypothetical protein